MGQCMKVVGVRYHSFSKCTDWALQLEVGDKSDSLHPSLFLRLHIGGLDLAEV